MRRQRYYNIFSIKETSEAMLQEVCKARRLNDSRIISQWSEIVDNATSSCAVPSRISYSNNRKILYLSTNNLSFFNKFPFYKQQIIDRINQYFGYGGINAIQEVKIKIL